MSANNANSNQLNGPSVVQPKPSLSIIDKALKLVTETAHYLMRLYFAILLYVYFWFVKIFTRALQPLEPLLKQMHTIPAGEVSAEGVRKQFSRLLCIILLFLVPLYNRVIGYATGPLVWARDKVVEYVEEGKREASKQTDPKAS